MSSTSRTPQGPTIWLPVGVILISGLLFSFWGAHRRETKPDGKRKQSPSPRLASQQRGERSARNQHRRTVQI